MKVLPNPPPLVRTFNISKVFLKGSTPIKALNNVSMDVYPGEFVAIMGPSGAGKSTLLYLLGCLDRPSSGNYFLSGKEVSKLSDRELSYIRATRIGFVFQAFNLVHQYNVIENVKIPFLYNDRNVNDAHTRAVNALKSVGLLDRINHFPSELSAGELQRAAIARALVIEPVLLLADEPTGNLDARMGEEIIGIFRRLNEKGMTILLVTHNAGIAKHAQRCVYLQDGSIKENQK